MRYMLLMSADESAMPAGPPPAEVFEMMGKYNADMLDAGVLLAAEGLTPGAEGAVITYPDGGPLVTDGPFTEAKELVAGFWILEVASREEALSWARRAPLGGPVRLEVRRIAEMAEFADVVPPEILDAEAVQRRRIAER